MYPDQLKAPQFQYPIPGPFRTYIDYNRDTIYMGWHFDWYSNRLGHLRSMFGEFLRQFAMHRQSKLLQNIVSLLQYFHLLPYVLDYK
jgi:hypothetical protein